MAISKLTIGALVKQTGLTSAKVKYRLKMLGIEGDRVPNSVYLYDPSVVKRILAWQPQADR